MFQEGVQDDPRFLFQKKSISQVVCIPPDLSTSIIRWEVIRQSTQQIYQTSRKEETFLEDCASCKIFQFIHVQTYCKTSKTFPYCFANLPGILFHNISEEYSESCQTSKMELFAKILNGFQLLTIFAKSSILDV